jgi:hypothetical protein
MLLTSTAGEANALVLDYRNRFVEQGRAAATVNLRLAAVRSLVKMARMTGLVSWTIEVQALKAEAYRDTRGVGQADTGVCSPSSINARMRKAFEIARSCA